MSEWAITGIILIVTGLVMIGLGRPLVAGKVGRNSLYGYRIAATLRDDRRSPGHDVLERVAHECFGLRLRYDRDRLLASGHEEPLSNICR